MPYGPMGGAGAKQPFEICTWYRGHIGIWCDGVMGPGGRKSGAYSRIKSEKKRTCLLVHGHLFSEFYTRQGSQPLLAALASQRVDENTLGLQHQPINLACRLTENAFT